MRHKLLIFGLLFFTDCGKCSHTNNVSDANASDVEGYAVDAPVDTESGTNSCPVNMVLVDGGYCSQLEHTCLEWMDSPGSIVRRCLHYAHNAVCTSGPEEHLTFCIDKYEYSDSSDNLPKSNISWTDAKKICESLDKRLCTESEWTLACEGNEKYPYPYGYDRDSQKCFIDQLSIVDGGEFLDLRKPVTDYKSCLSPFGVQNMTGNVDEWTSNMQRQPPMRSMLKGGWWGPLRNRCRVVTAGHDEYFKEVSVGFRCCKNL